VSPDHLYLGGPPENTYDKMSRKRNNPPVGERSRTAKLTWDLVAEIRLKRANGMVLREIAESYGIGISATHAIVTNKSWVV
jgi:hypothetical protein